MRYLIIISFIISAATTELSAEPDSLIVNWKDGKTEKISVKSFNKITIGETTLSIDNATNNELRIQNIIPNPAIEKVKVIYLINKPGNIKLNIFDLNGRKINELNSVCHTGINYIDWDCTIENGFRVKPGFYYFELQTANEKCYGKFMIIN